jgi:PKD repeat protein
LETGVISGDLDGECGVVLTSDGNEGKMSTITFCIRLPNRPPTAEAGGPYDAYEGVSFILDASDSSDPDNNIASYEWDTDDDGEYDDKTGVSPSIKFGDNGTYSIGLMVTDDYGESSTATAEVNVYNVVPAVIANPTNQTLQYSDKIAPVYIVAEDVKADTMTAFTWWSVDGSAFVSGLPSGLVLTHQGCSVDADGIKTCTWALEGTANVHAGLYTVHVMVKDEDGGQFPILTVTINVLSEDATIVFDSNNDEAVLVDIAEGDSGSFSLSVRVNEALPDLPAGMGEPGDISLADVKMRLVPVGPGLTVVPTSWTKDVNGTEYGAVLSLTCNFDDVPVNTYIVEVIMDGNYYTGYAEDMLVVYDPRHAFTNGVGWFYWPETSEKTDFEFSLKYDKKDELVQGSLLLIRYLPNGSSYRIQSKRLYGLALGESSAPAYGWVSFSGKASYIEPGWSEPIGDYEFVVYIEDHKPGTGPDRFWIEVHDSDANVVDVMSMDRRAIDNTIVINRGNIIVPHRRN